MQICECGCGQPITPRRWHRWTRPRFVRGHVSHEVAMRRGASRAYKPQPGEIPTGLCECGCGGKTGIARVTYVERRHFRGHPVPFLPSHGVNPCGAANHAWRGGRRINRRGYVLVRCPEHPNAPRNGYVFEHRLVMERVLGRLLQPHEVVHHINQVRHDNRPENLQLMTKREHDREHQDERLAAMLAAQTPESQSEAGKKGAAARWGTAAS